MVFGHCGATWCYMENPLSGRRIRGGRTISPLIAGPTHSVLLMHSKGFKQEKKEDRQQTWERAGCCIKSALPSLPAEDWILWAAEEAMLLALLAQTRIRFWKVFPTALSAKAANRECQHQGSDGSCYFLFWRYKIDNFGLSNYTLFLHQIFTPRGNFNDLWQLQ